MRANLAAFRRWRIEPRVLCDLSHREWQTSLLGLTFPAPILLAPVGVQGIFHPDGELASARAAAALGIPVILSSASSVALEDVAATMGDAHRWFQLYWSADPDIATSFLKRAEGAGYSAIVVTVDCPILSWRERDLANAYTPFLHSHGIANYLTDPAFCAKLACVPAQDPGAAIQRFIEIFGNAGLTWDDLPFLRRHTRLPIVLKGILRPDDAARAMDAGVDGIVVSNHGGRQVDGAVASLEALPRVVERVAGRVPVLLDGGVRRGADAVKALALGASAVLLGRLYAWGLAVGGRGRRARGAAQLPGGLRSHRGTLGLRLGGGHPSGVAAARVVAGPADPDFPFRRVQRSPIDVGLAPDQARPGVAPVAKQPGHQRGERERGDGETADRRGDERHRELREARRRSP